MKHLKVIIPKNQQEKAIGLLAYDIPPQNWGMLFFDVDTIHTMGMKYPIDVVFLDQNLCVIDQHLVQPNISAITVENTKHILELADGTANQLGLQSGTCLRLYRNYIFF